MARTNERDVPTVVVSRRVRPGRERDFARWVRKLLAAAERAPGHLDATLEAPDDAHPDEWVVVYRFADVDRLQSWLASPIRRRLLEAGAELIDGPAREQVVALTVEPEPVTAVSSVRVRHGHEDAYRSRHAELARELEGFDGFRRCELFEPVRGVQDDTVVVFSFDGREHLDAWLVSPERRRVLDLMEPHVEGDRTVNVVGGFAGWFAAKNDDRGVRRWKQAATVLLALFPTSLLLTVVRDAVAPGLPLVPAVLVGNAAGVAVLTWVLMPWLTRLLVGWLHR